VEDEGLGLGVCDPVDVAVVAVVGEHSQHVGDLEESILFLQFAY
jgi:hypothetical protein